jgi:Meckel syndrome type 1 protein
VPVAAAPVPAPVADSASGGDVAAVPTGEVETLPAPPVGGTDIVPTAAAPAQQKDASILPWLIGGVLLAGALAYALLRRRRRTDDYVENERAYEEPVAAYTPEPEPVIAPEPVRAPQPVAAAPTITAAAPAAPIGGSILTAPIIGTGFAAAAAPRPAPVSPAAPTAQGAPEIDLSMRAIRAGMQADGARVEFELTVGNSGSVPAEDVRVSTWMLAAGASETERALIAPADHADTPPVTIPAGETRTLQAAVGLTSAEVTGDAVLPVVVADATYRLPDGSTGHATARVAVGVPDGEELAHFSVDNPSGLHEGVVARELG